jgi:competence protein ComEC
MTAINVGYGDAILLEETEEDVVVFRILVDGGSGEDAEFHNNATGRIRAADYLARKGIDSLDLLVVTHIHEDHVCGLEPFIMNGGRVGELWTPYLLPPAYGGQMLDTPNTQDTGRINFITAINSYNRIFQYLTKQGCIIKKITGSRGVIPLSDNFKADVLSPSDMAAEKLAEEIGALYDLRGTGRFETRLADLDAGMNGYSMALRFHYRGKKILLPGDACPSPRLMTEWDGRLAADILKLAHHGQRDSISGDFIRAVSPRLVVTCSSSDRRYNSAHPGVYRDTALIMGEAGIESEYLFTDHIKLPPWQTEDKPRSALVINIDQDDISWALQPPR